MKDTLQSSRRNFIELTAAGLASLVLPSWALAQTDGPIKIAALIPLTGGGGAYGPSMQQAAQLVVNEVNAAGGLLGRKVQLLVEDDQTNPEAAVRAARKLIDVDKVSAIIGTWASSVTSAVAPLCWENKVFLATVSGGEAITSLPHQGFLIRTQPTTALQGKVFAEYAHELGGKRILFMGPQTPLSQSYVENIGIHTKRLQGEAFSLLYEDKKNSYRTEVSQALKNKPDVIILGGYVPDTAVVIKDIYRTGYAGKIIGASFGVNQKLIEAVPKEVLEGVYSIAPSPSINSTTYKRLATGLKVANVDTYSAQVYDHANLVLMAMAKANNASGTAIRDNVRFATTPNGGKMVDNAVDGINAIKSNTAFNYTGASGPCQFTKKGDILSTNFRYEQIKNGKLVLIKVQ